MWGEDGRVGGGPGGYRDVRENGEWKRGVQRAVKKTTHHPRVTAAESNLSTILGA